MTRAWYATRERVMRASDIKASAYLSSEIDSAIEQASQAVDDLCQRGDGIRPGFAPWQGSVTYNWPIRNNDDAYRFYLNRQSLFSLDSVVSGGIDITADSFGWPTDGPPYRAVDVNVASSNLFTFIDGIGQRSLVITGTWCGVPVLENNQPTWQLGSSPSSTDTQITLNMPFGVGSILRVGSERMLVTDRTWLDSGQSASLTLSAAAQTLAVSNGAGFLIGEELLIDSERVLIRDIAGNNLTVERAYSGSVLAAHVSSEIFYGRSATISRGALGSTAAGHSSGALVYRYSTPKVIEQLTVAYAQDQRAQENANYARTVGSGSGQHDAGGVSIPDLEERVLASYGRRLRFRAV